MPENRALRNEKGFNEKVSFGKVKKTFFNNDLLHLIVEGE
jgi:hypothetical protein